MDLGLYGFDLVALERRVQDAVSEEGQGLFHLALVDEQGEIGHLPGVGDLHFSAQLAETFFLISSGFRLRSLKMTNYIP